jgi:hypothetical protein
MFVISLFTLETDVILGLKFKLMAGLLLSANQLTSPLAPKGPLRNTPLSSSPLEP